MGLATVLGIVRGHPGVVQIESAPGRGTRVRVLTPSSRLLPTTREAPAPTPWPEPGCGRLLVVDDDPDVPEVAREFLARSGYHVATANGGRDGVACFAEDPSAFDAVILDVAMPDVGGREVFRAMRRLRPELPVVLASGYSEEFMAERFSAPGATACLRKPYEPETLVAQVRRALSERSQASADVESRCVRMGRSGWPASAWFREPQLAAGGWDAPAAGGAGRETCSRL
jgi:two-component system cell cycle sensor histidine kinase/response regulator CckA